ncbi:MAG TPA: nuclear transport factor 2 family protein [Gaiellaceae bacterium]|nr:nuclear transport factor 2 family protein [Gaiellaceae bacterium]
MDDPRGVMERQAAALNAHDVDALADCFHEDLQSDDLVHPSQTFRGREQVRRNWTLMIQNVPDLQAELRGTAVEGDTVWAEWRIYGTRRDGQMLDLRGVVISRVRDGRIVASRRYIAPLDVSNESVDDYFRRLIEPAA